LHHKLHVLIWSTLMVLTNETHTLIVCSSDSSIGRVKGNVNMDSSVDLIVGSLNLSRDVDFLVGQCHGIK